MSGPARRAERTRRRVWGAPLLLAGSSLAGLVLALLGDGPWDAASWLALGVPVAVIAWCVRRPRRTTPGPVTPARAGMPGRR